MFIFSLISLRGRVYCKPHCNMDFIISGMVLSLMAVEWTGRWFLLLQRRRRHVIDIQEQNVVRLHHDGGNQSKKRVQLQSCVEQRVTACCVPIGWCVVSDHSSSHIMRRRIKLLTVPVHLWLEIREDHHHTEQQKTTALESWPKISPCWSSLAWDAPKSKPCRPTLTHVPHVLYSCEPKIKKRHKPALLKNPPTESY